MPPGHPIGSVFRPFLGLALVLSLVLLAQAGDVWQLGVLASPYSSQNTAPLSPGSTIERELAGGETHEYSLMPVADEFVRVLVEQRGVDVVLALRAPDGKLLAEVDSPLGIPDQKSLSFVAEQGGEYRLTVRASRKDAARGAYVLKAEEWRHAETKNRSIAAGERAFAEAERQTRQNRAEATKRAIEKYGEALGYWRAAEYRVAEAFTLLKMGLARHNLSQFKEAIDRYTQALPIWEQMGDERAVAQVLNNLGWSYSALGHPQTALDLYTRSLEIRRRLNDPRGTAQTLNLAADALGALGEPRQAVARYLEAATLAQAAADHNIEAYALNGLGWLHMRMGEYNDALAFIDRALPVWHNLGNRRGEAYALNIRGSIYSRWLEVAEAQKSYQQAQTMLQELGDRFGEAQGLNNLGILYYYVADYGRAKESYIEALAIWESIGNQLEESKTLNNLGLISWKTGRLRESLDYSGRASTLSHAVGYREGEAASLHNVGLVHSALGDTQQALEYCERALKLYQEIGNAHGAATALHDLGFLYESLGDDQRAFDYYTQSLKQSFLPAQLGLARLELKRGDLSAARAHVEAVIKTREGRSAKIPDQEMRISYVASVRYAYELHAEILMRLHDRAVPLNQPSDEYLAAALATSERARARGLLEALAETHADIRKGVERALLTEETALREKLGAGEMRRLELLSSPGHEKRLAALEKENEELERRFNDVQARIRTTSPRYAALTQLEPLSLPEVQLLLDDDTLLLEFLGKDRSFLWAVAPGSVKGYFLPGRAEIEKYARRMYALLSESDHPPSGESSSAARAQAVEYKEEAVTLSRLLLGQVAAQLGHKRLLIVSDGVLQYLPFAALPTPVMEGSGINSKGPEATAAERTRRTASPTVQPLIRDHEIVNLPSASVLAGLRRELTGRPSAPKTLAVLADPRL